MVNSDNIQQLNSGVIWVLVSHFSVIGMQFIAMIFLARLLTPKDFAIMGIATFFIAISHTLADSGLGGALLKKKEIKGIDYSTLFIYNVIVAIIIYIVLLFLARPLSVFYDVETLEQIIYLIGLSILFGSFGIIQQVILLRELKFRQMTIISIISSFTGLVTAIILAAKGFGVISLVVQNMIQIGLTVILQLFCNRYFPILKFSRTSFKEQWSFGGHLLYSNLLNTAYDNVFSMIFPKISTLKFSGLYAQANKIKQLPVNIISSAINTAAFPILSKIENTEEFKQVNRNLASKVYLFSYTIIIAISIFSKEVIHVILGEQWLDAASILSILSIKAVFFIVSMFVRNSLKSMGATYRIFYIELANSLIGLIMLGVTFYLGDYYILLGIVISQIITTFISTLFLSLEGDYKLNEQWLDFFDIIKIFFFPVFIVLAFKWLVELDDVFTAVIGGLIYFISLFVSGIMLKNLYIMKIYNNLVRITGR